MAKVKGFDHLAGAGVLFWPMSVLRLPSFSSIPQLSCVLVGRADNPRPDPVTLLPLLGHGPTPRLASLRQIHSDRCLIVTEPMLSRVDGRTEVGEGDAMVTSLARVALGIATADCLPLVAVDPAVGVLGVVHAGWRGTVAGVLRRALEAMCEQLGARPERILVGAGPGAGVCCYRVGSDVVAQYLRAFPDRASELFRRDDAGDPYLDLVAANRIQALNAGVPARQFEALGLCTICHPRLCHSYRRDGPAAGRMWLLAALRERS